MCAQARTERRASPGIRPMNQKRLYLLDAPPDEPPEPLPLEPPVAPALPPAPVPLPPPALLPAPLPLPEVLPPRELIPWLISFASLRQVARASPVSESHWLVPPFVEDALLLVAAPFSLAPPADPLCANAGYAPNESAAAAMTSVVLNMETPLGYESEVGWNARAGASVSPQGMCHEAGKKPAISTVNAMI
jgi:hypothetical protein